MTEKREELNLDEKEDPRDAEVNVLTSVFDPTKEYKIKYKHAKTVVVLENQIHGDPKARLTIPEDVWFCVPFLMAYIDVCELTNKSGPVNPERPFPHRELFDYYNGNGDEKFGDLVKDLPFNDILVTLCNFAHMIGCTGLEHLLLTRHLWGMRRLYTEDSIGTGKLCEVLSVLILNGGVDEKTVTNFADTVDKHVQKNSEYEENFILKFYTGQRMSISGSENSTEEFAEMLRTRKFSSAQIETIVQKYKIGSSSFGSRSRSSSEREV